MKLKTEAPRLRKVIKTAGPTCPLRIQKVIGKLSHGNPTCGIFQIAGDIGEVSKADEVLRNIAKGNYTLLHTFRAFCRIKSNSFYRLDALCFASGSIPRLRLGH